MEKTEESNAMTKAQNKHKAIKAAARYAALTPEQKEAASAKSHAKYRAEHPYVKRARTEEDKVKLTEHNLELLRKQALESPEGREASLRGMTLDNYQRELKECDEASERLAKMVIEETPERSTRLDRQRHVLDLFTPEWYAEMTAAGAEYLFD